MLELGPPAPAGSLVLSAASSAKKKVKARRSRVLSSDCIGAIAQPPQTLILFYSSFPRGSISSYKIIVFASTLNIFIWEMVWAHSFEPLGFQATEEWRVGWMSSQYWSLLLMAEDKIRAGFLRWQIKTLLCIFSSDCFFFLYQEKHLPFMTNVAICKNKQNNLSRLRMQWERHCTLKTGSF